MWWGIRGCSGRTRKARSTVLKVLRRELVDPKIAERRGAHRQGDHDGPLVEFQSFVNAVRCAIGWQCSMAECKAGERADGRIDFSCGSINRTRGEVSEGPLSTH
jgi:hypothetical protein